MNNKLKYTIAFLLITSISIFAFAQKKKSQKTKTTTNTIYKKVPPLRRHNTSYTFPLPAIFLIKNNFLE